MWMPHYEQLACNYMYTAATRLESATCLPHSLVSYMSTTQLQSATCLITASVRYMSNHSFNQLHVYYTASIRYMSTTQLQSATCIPHSFSPLHVYCSQQCCKWTNWRVSCQELHLHFFGFKRIHAFLLQVDALTAVPSFCRLSLKIFFTCMSMGEVMVHFYWSAHLVTKIKSRDSFLCRSYTMAEGSLAFKSRGFQPIKMRYNSVPCVLVT